MFAALAREHIFAGIFFRPGAKALASEHATRLAAMQYALCSIIDPLAEMAGDFCRTRRKQITTELMDVVAAFEMPRAT